MAASTTGAPSEPGPPPVARPDIRRVAAEAGVSTATVSRVVTGRGPASEDAVRKVRLAVERLHYLPNASASSLRTDRSMILGVLVPNLANPVYLPFIRQVEHLAQAHGYAVIVADTQRSRDVEHRQLDRLNAQRIDGLVVAGRPADPGRVRRLRESGLPVADLESAAAETGPSPEALATPAIDEACRHLASLGHHRLAFLARGAPRRARSGSRWHLIDAAGRSHGLEPTRVAVDDQPDHLPAANRMAHHLESLVRGPDGPTVLWSNSAVLTPLVLEGLALTDITLPDECSFLTFGDSAWASAYRPGISVIRADLGSLATDMTRSLLIRLGVAEPGPPVSIEPDVYVPRGSVGPPPRSGH
ncbi:MAG: LacI family DNA-binding transcriptional regulator [Acidimicrobiales bacterium]